MDNLTFEPWLAISDLFNYLKLASWDMLFELHTWLWGLQLYD